MRNPNHIRRHSAAVIAAAVLTFALLALAPALSHAALTRPIHFGGETVHAPASWPVFRLSQHPEMCVRLDRRAVYLGTPSPNQSCPASAIGRRQAIVVEPKGAARARASAIPVPPTRLRSAPAGPFTGLGFDACSTPSTKTMAAWTSSPYRAIGVYIGGENRACSQPNLTSSWVASQTAAGWHLIPTYVGAQAPTSSCSSCGKLSASRATAQGVAAATDAVAQASAVAMGPGSPIYFDMESYSRTSAATNATLAFLEAWTEQLHALGYVSGVYSSSASGIADLADAAGSGYTSPDDLWIANWNGARNTLDSVVPSNLWANHQRIHQYEGGHDETYGGATINIDNDYVDASTVGTATLPGEDDPVGAIELTGTPGAAQVRVKGWAYDPDAPSEAVGIRVYVGGKAGTANALSYEAGPAAIPRKDVTLAHPEAIGSHGFDVTIPTVKSGRQPVCTYAINVGPGADRLLGCKTLGIPLAISLSHVRATPGGVRLRIACEWPAGTECPGHLALRARYKVALPHRRGTPPRIRVFTSSLGSRTFHLTGARSHAFAVALTESGRALLRSRGSLRTQLIAAIPGGRRVAVLSLRHRAG